MHDRTRAGDCGGCDPPPKQRGKGLGSQGRLRIQASWAGAQGGALIPGESPRPPGAGPGPAVRLLFSCGKGQRLRALQSAGKGQFPDSNIQGAFSEHRGPSVGEATIQKDKDLQRTYASTVRVRAEGPVHGKHTLPGPPLGGWCRACGHFSLAGGHRGKRGWSVEGTGGTRGRRGFQLQPAFLAACSGAQGSHVEQCGITCMATPWQVPLAPGWVASR